MNNLRLKALLGAGCFSLALIGSAQLAAFIARHADTDHLFEDGNFNMRAGVTYVSPQREFQESRPGLLDRTRYYCHSFVCGRRRATKLQFRYRVQGQHCATHRLSCATYSADLWLCTRKSGG